MTDNISLEFLQMMLKAKDAEILALRQALDRSTETINAARLAFEHCVEMGMIKL